MMVLSYKFGKLLNLSRIVDACKICIYEHHKSGNSHVIKLSCNKNFRVKKISI